VCPSSRQKKNQKSNRRKQILPRFAKQSGIFLALFSIGASLIAIEFGLKHFRPVTYGKPLERFRELPYRRSSIPGLNYELMPNVQGPYRDATVTINSHGMRDREPLENRDGRAPITRIVALGDSYTFGFGVAAEETYPFQLEVLLKPIENASRRFDVLNLGVGGYATQDEALYLQGRGLNWNPSLVIVGYCLNDPDPAPDHPLYWHFAPRRFWQRFHLTRLIAHAHYGWESQHYGHGNYVKSVHANPRTWQTVTQGFDLIRRETSTHNIPVLLVIFPLIETSAWADYDLREIHSLVASEGRKKGFFVLDLLQPFEKHDPAALRVSRFDAHPSPLAHRIAATELLSLIQREPRLAESLGIRVKNSS
jgi:hypothetical protein